jgi:DNA-binding transcriptional regulator/RsmH inhibitor MraZ
MKNVNQQPEPTPENLLARGTNEDSIFNPAYIHVLGHRETLSLDSRMRFRLPDHLAASLTQEMGRVAGRSNLPPAAQNRMAFYFVPGTNSRIFLYPAQNIEVAVSRFESPPSGIDPSLVRAARDYFYSMMTFVEADRQNRLQIPDHLSKHGEIGEDDKKVVLVSHNLWLSVSRASTANEIETAGRDALDKVGPDVLDPVNIAQQFKPRDNAKE